jgi:HAD superfamily hydrolase (TIGR01549 family)
LIKNIIFDFDGVILDSVPVKTEAFRRLFDAFNNKLVEQLIKYHLENGGKSRYLKIEYFFVEILNKSISQEEILKYANKYSEITKEELSNSKYLIQEVLNFIKNNHKKYNMHVASGADEEDLLYICEQLNINQYFLSIYGSPAVKNQIVSNLLLENQYDTNETILIGDSKNDYDAAYENGINFYGYNNKNISNIINTNYIESFTAFEKSL